jgi:hypothetical protein
MVLSSLATSARTSFRRPNAIVDGADFITHCSITLKEDGGVSAFSVRIASVVAPHHCRRQTPDNQPLTTDGPGPSSHSQAQGKL